MSTVLGFVLLLVWCCTICLAVSSKAPVDVILFKDSTLNSTKVSVSALAGLKNRVDSRVMIVRTAADALWISRLNVFDSFDPTYYSAEEYLSVHLENYSCLVYNEEQIEVMGPVISLAGVLNAVPLTESMHALYPSCPILLNCSSVFATFTAESAVEWVRQRYLNQTLSLAMQKNSDLEQGYLVDFIVARRLFVQYLPDGCLPETEDNKILKELVAAAPWKRPVRVYGYNSLDPLFGGDLFEAETDCINVMGQVATEFATNLAFWSHFQPLSPGDVLLQPSPQPLRYDTNVSYVALVYGDMDNLDIVMTFGADHMQYRAQQCALQRGTSPCFPLTWTLSPNLIDLSPAVLKWFYSEASQSNGSDWFIMPPSGTLYSYPGMMPPEVQDEYVKDQTTQAVTMNTSGTVHWEWFFAWDAAWTSYFPKYLTGSETTRAFFLNDVPWVIPIPDMWLQGETYRFVGGYNRTNPVVGFRPAFNWMEGSSSGGLPNNASDIAAMIGNFSPGSVQYVYMIQNTPVQSVFEMVSLLPNHVKLVGYQELVSLAVQRELLKR